MVSPVLDVIVNQLFTARFRMGIAVARTGVVGVTPRANGVPGSAAIQSIADGIAWWALLLSLLGLVIGAAAWALGSHSSNYQYATTGRRAVIVSGLAALVIGAAPAMINFFFATGQQVH
jgi:hypothetical protein